jgi:hypothetical protein
MATMEATASHLRCRLGMRLPQIGDEGRDHIERGKDFRRQLVDADGHDRALVRVRVYRSGGLL